MARTPRASVSKTYGQGVSRLAYQKRYEMTRDKAPKVKVDKLDTPAVSRSREYSKGGKYPYKMHVSYGSTLHPSSLEDVEALGRRKPPKGYK